MNAKAIVPLVLAVVLGLVAALLVRNAMTHKTPITQGNLVTVVVAKQSVEPGRQLAKEDLMVSQVPTDAAPGQVFSDPAQLVGRVPTTSLVKGQAILETLLAPTGTGAGLQSLLPPGMRAMTLEVNEFTGVGGMMTVGCHVDLMGIIKDPKTGDAISRTILQNLKVEAIGRSVSNTPPADGQAPPPPSNAITLLCTPHQAQIIQLALITSRPWFVLRSTRDGQELPLEGTTMAELRDDDNSNESFASAPPPPTDGSTPAPPVDTTPFVSNKRTIQIFRGGAESQVTITIAGSRGVTAGADTGPAIAPN
jgi:pilus assembly protein CpaB